MNFDSILNSNIVIDSKVCKDEKKDCIKGIGSVNGVGSTNCVGIDGKGKEQGKEQGKDSNDKENEKEVNITIKSCKNITSKQALLIIPITKFFSNRDKLNKLITILKGESISLRLIDWFVTNYCKKFNILYNLNDYRSNTGQTEAQRNSFDNFIIVHTNYKGQLKAYSKRNFDPFCRRNRIRFYYEDNKYFITIRTKINYFIIIYI